MRENRTYSSVRGFETELLINEKIYSREEESRGIYSTMDMEYKKHIYSIEEIAVAVNEIANSYPSIEEIILFGSYARQQATSCSDIDLLITSPEKIRPMIMWSFLGDVKDELQKPVEVFRLGDIDQNSEFFQSVMKEGIKIYGK